MAWRNMMLFVAALLPACASRAPSVALLPPLRPVAVIAPTPINAALSPAAALWHLRAGLNVAALSCRGAGEAALVAHYNAMLAAHKTALAAAEAAYQAQYRTDGGDWRDRYDDDQTRLYNFFGQAHGRAALCAAADETFAGLAAIDDANLMTVASDHLAALDRAFAPPRLDVDARVFGAPTLVMMAMR